MSMKHYCFSGLCKSPGQGCVSINSFGFVCSDLSWALRGNHCAGLWFIVGNLGANALTSKKFLFAAAATQVKPGQLSTVLLVSGTHLSSYFPKQLRQKPEKTLLGKGSHMGKFWCTMQVVCSSQYGHEAPIQEYGNLGASFLSPCKTCKMFHTGNCITLPSVPIFKLETGRAAYGEEENNI